MIALIIIGAALVASILAVVPYLSLASKPDSPRRIFALDPHKYYFYSSQKEPITMNAVRIGGGDLVPNSFVWFLDPYGKTMQDLHPENKSSITLSGKQLEQFQNRDPYENYMLIRLPEWIGGGKDSVSALRAYHAVSLSDKCLHRYFSDEGRWRMENPCAGDMYRPWDGYAFAGPASQGSVGFVISKGFYPALQKLRLSVDSEGYVVAFRPDNSPRGDGAKGEGRQLSPGDLEESNREMILAASEYSGYKLPLPARILPDYYLSELTPTGGPWWMTQQAEGTKRALEALYSTSRGEYAPITIDVFPLDRFPDMALGRSAVSRSSAGSGYVINATLVSALIHLDYYYNSVPDGLLQVRNGTDIAGQYAVLTAPSKLEDKEDSNIGAGALVWGKSIDGKKEIVVVINARNMTMDELTRLVKSIEIS